MPRTLKFGQGNGADFLVLYAENYGDSLDETGQTAPRSGASLGAAYLAFYPHRIPSAMLAE